MIEIGVERGNRDALVVGGLEDRAFADHLAVLVTERRVPHLPDLEAQHVVREDSVGRLHGVGAAERQLAQRRRVPDTDVVADRVVLGDGVAEVLGPVPAFPVEVLDDAHRALRAVERRPQGLIAHRGHLRFPETKRSARSHDEVGAARRGLTHVQPDTRGSPYEIYRLHSSLHEPPDWNTEATNERVRRLPCGRARRSAPNRTPAR